MRNVRKLAFVLSLGLLTGAAPPQPVTIFGLELGKPIALPPCKHKILPGGIVSQFTYEDDPAETCHEPDVQLSDAPWRRGSVDFPLSKMPTILAFPKGFTLFVEGKMEGLQFSTLDRSNTNAIIRELTAKFGRPSSVHSSTSIISGIAVPTVEAEWNLSNLHVSYRNIDSSIEYGLLMIETGAMQKFRHAHQQAQEAQRTKL